MAKIYLIWGTGNTILHSTGEPEHSRRALMRHRSNHDASDGLKDPQHPICIATTAELSDHQLRTAATHSSTDPRDNLLRVRKPGQDTMVCTIWAEDLVTEHLHVIAAWVGKGSEDNSVRAVDWVRRHPGVPVTTGHFYVDSGHINKLMTEPHEV